MKYKIVISGGPGSGKTTIIDQLILKNYKCFNEISRSFLKKNKFLDKPIEISEKIIDKRIKHFIKSEGTSLTKDKPFIFFDRGIHDVSAYLDYIEKPHKFHKKIQDYKYDLVFLLELNKKNFINDNERIETFKQASIIHDYIKKSYQIKNHSIIDVPWMNINMRLDLILNHCYKTFKL